MHTHTNCVLDQHDGSHCWLRNGLSELTQQDICIEAQLDTIKQRFEWRHFRIISSFGNDYWCGYCRISNAWWEKTSIDIWCYHWSCRLLDDIILWFLDYKHWSSAFRNIIRTNGCNRLKIYGRDLPTITLRNILTFTYCW